ncbi:MAG: hypothetical protein R6V07_04755, partial [Armatimonadota bacterium]
MPLTVAIIGCGNIARRHIAGYQKVEGAEFVAMCDLDGEKAAILHDVGPDSELSIHVWVRPLLLNSEALVLVDAMSTRGSRS